MINMLVGVCVAIPLTWFLWQRWRQMARRRKQSIAFKLEAATWLRLAHGVHSYTHRAHGDHVVYEWTLSGKVRVAKVNGQSIPPDQWLPWLLDWDNGVADLAKAELAKKTEAS